MNHAADASPSMVQALLGLIEFPFLFSAIIFGFLTARALRGGVFGKGMALISAGSLVMAIGHLHMQIDQFFGVNLFAMLLGRELGAVAWFVALVITWGLSGTGFYLMYSAARGKSSVRSYAAAAARA